MVELLEPAAILSLDADGADELLDRLEADVPSRGRLTILPQRPFRNAFVFGDTHGDWRSTEAPISRFLEAQRESCLIGLGDYVDRAPQDSGEGSVANALWLLQLAARFPEQVYLIVGNHEMARRIPVLPHDLPEEVDQLWGPDPARYSRIVSLLERGPLAAISPNGVYLAHGGFPRGPPSDWRERFTQASDDTVIDVTWSDCSASRIDRGLGPKFDEAELSRFLDLSTCRVFVRGHDPDVTGRPLYHNRCLTLHTTRFYERFGGVVYATVPLDRPVESTDEITIEHAPSEGRTYPIP